MNTALLDPSSEAVKHGSPTDSPILLGASNCSPGKRGMTGKYQRTPEQQKRARDMCLKFVQQRSPETEARRLEALRNSEKNRKNSLTGKQFNNASARKRNRESIQNSAIAKATHQRVAREILRSPSVLKKNAAAVRMAKQKHWHLKSPNNVIYEFKNVISFVRDNAGLFDPDDLVWKKTGTKSLRCRATTGLQGLRPTRRWPAAVWKGWTWVSIVERFEECVALECDREND